jgi:hypothetical protein
VTLIRNEQTKLLAAALNTGATSSFAIGVLAPVAAAFYNVNGANHVPVEVLALGAVVWIGAACTLHLAARYVLKGLRI